MAVREYPLDLDPLRLAAGTPGGLDRRLPEERA
jgi:hypothetical protein